jgi:hypothetical protein
VGRLAQAEGIGSLRFLNRCPNAKPFSLSCWVHFLELIAGRIGSGASGKNAQEQHLGLGQPPAQLLDDRRDASGNLVGRVGPGVVGADHQDRDLGMNSVDLTVLDAPEDMLRAVAADPEIGRVAGPVEPLPHLIIVPSLGDRVAQEEEVDVALPGLIEELLVHLHPPPLARGRSDGVRSLCMSRRPGREDTPETHSSDQNSPRVPVGFPHGRHLSMGKMVAHERRRVAGVT